MICETADGADCLTYLRRAR